MPLTEKQCAFCGKTFWSRSTRNVYCCTMCQKRAERAAWQRPNKEARARAIARLKATYAKKPSIVQAVDTSKCPGCVYWRYLDVAAGGAKCCHHLLDTGHIKKVENGVCISRWERGGTGKGSK